MNQERSLATLRLAALAAIAIGLLAACPDPLTSPTGPDITTGTGGATTLAASADGRRIYIGHITYDADGGALKYYDTDTGAIETIVEGVDVGDFVLDEARNQIIGTSNAWSSRAWTYYIDLSTTPYEAVEIQQAGDSFVGSDLLLHNGTVFVVNNEIDWSFPFTADSTLYYFPANDFGTVTKVDLATAQAYAFTRVGVYDNELYFTDTLGGDVWKSNLTGGGLTRVTTAGDGAATMIYFHEDRGLVLDGLGPAMGVYTFDPAAALPTSATQFAGSAAISAQFMAFTSATEAFVTNFAGGVYKFDPGNTSSPFTIVADTDPSYLDGATYGLQDILIANGRLYVAINGWGGKQSGLMIVDSF